MSAMVLLSVVVLLAVVVFLTVLSPCSSEPLSRVCFGYHVNKQKPSGCAFGLLFKFIL
jgi:hypothetical protein